MRYSFRLKEGRDQDLIAWLESFGEGERSTFLRQALRTGIQAMASKVDKEIINKPVRKVPKIIEPVKISKEEAESKLNNLVNNF